MSGTIKPVLIVVDTPEILFYLTKFVLLGTCDGCDAPLIQFYVS